MEYTVKWIHDNMGITRDMIRYYEKEKLLPANTDGKYRKYSYEDIEKIWGIKLLINIGFSAKEIYALMNAPKFDFDSAIADKVKELECIYEKASNNLEFAKSIKLIGRIPTTTKMGSALFDDFIQYARDHWNFYDDPRTAPFMKVVEAYATPKEQVWTPEEMKAFLAMYEDMDMEIKLFIYTLHGYFRILADMKDLAYSDETVIRIVRTMYNYLIKHSEETEFEKHITPLFFAKSIIPYLLNGDIGKQSENLYTKEGCIFIAQAIAYYAGCKVDEL